MSRKMQQRRRRQTANERNDKKNSFFPRLKITNCDACRDVGSTKLLLLFVLLLLLLLSGICCWCLTARIVHTQLLPLKSWHLSGGPDSRRRRPSVSPPVSQSAVCRLSEGAAVARVSVAVAAFNKLRQIKLWQTMASHGQWGNCNNINDAPPKHPLV